MISCEVELCIYNDDFKCTSDIVEIESSGKCYQCMTVSIPKETLDMTPQEALKMIKREH